MRSGIIKSTYEDTYVFPPPPEYKFLQFGGTGDDIIDDIKTLSDGTIICSIRTKSTSFLGLDLSAYTDGSYHAFGLLKIDPNLPPTGFLLGYYFVNGNGKSFGGGNNGPKIRISTDDYIYYVMGTSSSACVDARAYGVRASDMTLQKTANKRLAEDWTVAVYYNWHHEIVGDYLYVYYGNNYTLVGKGGYIQKLRLSDLEQISDTYIYNPVYMIAQWIETDGTYLYGAPSSNGSPVKTNLTPSYLIESPYTNFTAGYPQNLVCDGSYQYHVGINVYGTTKRVWVYCINAAMDAYRWGGGYWSAVEPDAGGAVGTPCVWLDTVSDHLGLVWPTSKNVVDAAIELSWYRIRRSDKATLQTGWVTYNSGTRIGSGQTGKSFYCSSKPHRYDTEKYYLSGHTNGNLTGFVNAGGYDCIIMKVDNTGKILA